METTEIIGLILIAVGAGWTLNYILDLRAEVTFYKKLSELQDNSNINK